VIGGLAMALILLPGAMYLGRAAKGSSAVFLAIPSNLNASPAGQTSYIYAADGTTLLTMFYEEHRHYVPLSDIPPVMQQAIISAEDTRFYHHPGVDPAGLARAFLANRAAGGVEQGASTLTMQYVRMDGVAGQRPDAGAGA
jgi:membrane peptidoglycan carboxypeptidase